MFWWYFVHFRGLDLLIEVNFFKSYLLGKIFIWNHFKCVRKGYSQFNSFGLELESKLTIIYLIVFWLVQLVKFFVVE